MSVLQRRSRLVSFRVSEGQYHTLKNLSIKRGARSLSDFLRSGVESMLERKRGKQGALRSEIAVLHEQVADLDRRIQSLTLLLKKS
jgi:hypothetical protein